MQVNHRDYEVIVDGHLTGGLDGHGDGGGA
jgi:hypothetical protein